MASRFGWNGMRSGGASPASPGASCGKSEEQQSELIEQLRGRFANMDDGITEVTLKRFLITRSWNLDGAAVMLQKHLAWRAENLPVSLEEVKPLLDAGTVSYFGNSVEGRPVLGLNFFELMKVDWKAPGEMQRHMRAVVYCAEAAIRSMPPGVETWTFVIDCTGIRAPPAAYMQEFTKVMQANYPERAHNIVMYPIPRFVVSVVRSFMVVIPEKTRSKVAFVSSVADLCEETGLDRAQLPERMLGAVDMEVLKGATALEIAAGRGVTHRHQLAAGEAVRWSFRVFEHNVSFELRFVASEDPASPSAGSSPASGVSAGAGAGYSLRKLDKVAEGEGEFSAEQAGTLEFTFDNSFSYLRGKSLIVSCLPLGEASEIAAEMAAAAHEAALAAAAAEGGDASDTSPVRSPGGSGGASPPASPAPVAAAAA